MMNRNMISLLILILFSGSLMAQAPAGYYDGTEGLSGEELKAKLHDIIDNHQEYSYNDLRDFILRDTDEDPNNSNNVILLYTGRSQAKSTFGGGANDWNREHVWAKSHGDFGNTPPEGTDAHHIRPTDASVNSSRGNLDFDNGGSQHSEATGCYYDNNSWEPRDEVKGDVARMIFYMAVRYEGGSGEEDLELADNTNSSPSGQPYHGKMSTLLQWNMEDPVDDFEMTRNNKIYSYQQNRNPFIDNPDWAEMIWGPNASASEELQSKVKLNKVGNTYQVTVDGINETVLVSVYGLDGKQINSFESDSKQFEVALNKQGVFLVQFTYKGVSFTEKLIF
jgi:endonuclease I